MMKENLRTWNLYHYRFNGVYEDFNKQACFKFFPLPDHLKIKYQRDKYNTALSAPDFFNCGC